MDVLLLTLLNAAACLVLPKLASKILGTKDTQTLAKGSTSSKARIEISSFPYCTSYVLTGKEFCKFRPQFCAKCSQY
jgi:hypothetical protein